ncbi:lmo1851 family serine protease [Bacillus massilinigeriensis]|uniref:lmo1851 family serine protease n=1 Tax=Bacillus massilionigeriensis TaxID=1805475 RepID=UPI00096AFF6D|nr:S41 family peptidase [Bacillus massilionigeriensis]
MDIEKTNEDTSQNGSGFIQIKKFHFIMLIFLVVFLAAGITAVALSFGDEEAVKVVNERSEFDKLYSAYDTISENYYQEVDKKTLVNGAINGMVESLDDPYSDYMDEKEAKKFHQTISSSFEGIGAEIEEINGNISIVSPLKGSPAEKAGLKPKDRVLSVNGKSLQGLSSTEAVTLIRGKKGTKVTLVIERPGTEGTMTISVVRDTIPIETVYGEMLQDGIAKIQITTFSENTSKEVIDKLNELQDKGMKGVILDLRQNPGGLLDQAVNIANLFVPNGKTVLKIQDRKGNIEEIKATNNNPKIPLVVVIDKGSASASEILAGAVSQSAGVPLVGEKSFGKGTVQNAKDFDDGSNLKFTTEKWLTPSGNWIHKKGIEPDYKVSLPDYASIPYINPDSKLKVTDSSDQIKAAEKMLKAIGYKPGKIDGYFDEKMKAAVIQFQKDEKLKADGILTGEDSLALMEKLGEKIRKNDTQLKKATEVLKKQMNQ